MKLVKTKDASDLEAELHMITERLRTFLNDFRKTKTARDLIGNDERFGGFDFDDFKAFADRLSAGVELTNRDNVAFRNAQTSLQNNAQKRTEPLRVNAAAMFSIAARFHVPIRVARTPYFLDNSASVFSSRMASSATLALNSGEWFFRFFILDHFSHHAIRLNDWSENSRPLLTTSDARG